MDFIFDPSLVLYLPLYQPDGASFASRDAYGHLCTVTGALWTPQGRTFDGADDIIDLGNNVQTVLDAFEIMNYPSNPNYEKALVRLQVIKKQLVQEAKRRWIYNGYFRGII